MQTGLTEKVTKGAKKVVRADLQGKKTPQSNPGDELLRKTMKKTGEAAVGEGLLFHGS